MTLQSTCSQRCKDNAGHSQPTKEVQAQFAANAKGFFPAQEARQRFATDGSEEQIKSNNFSPFYNLLGQVHQGLILWILIVAGVILALLGGSVDVIAVVLLNAVIVLLQEFNVEKPPEHSTLEDDRRPQHAHRT